MIRKAVCVCAVMVMACPADAQPVRKLPPVAPPITREDVAGTETTDEEAEAEIAEAEAAEQAGVEPADPLDDLTPEERVRFEAFLARLGTLFAQSNAMKEGSSLAIDDAAELIDALYEDMGAPYLNSRWQWMVVTAVQDVLFAHPKQPWPESEAMDVLRTGMLNYAAEAAPQDPCQQAALALALAGLGGPQHPECDDAAERLMDRATAWAAELEDEFYISMMKRGQKSIDRVTRWKWGPNGRPAATKKPADAARAYQEAEAAVSALASDGSVNVEQLAKADRLASADFGEPRRNADMLSRLLIAYRAVLKEGRVEKDAVRFIDGKLLSLARDSGRLSGERHWSLWAEAVSELRHRSSREMRRYVFHDGGKQHADVPVALEGLRKAQAGLRRDGAPGSLVVGGRHAAVEERPAKARANSVGRPTSSQPAGSGG